MSIEQTLYVVTYTFYCDPDTTTTVIFDDKKAQESFEDVIWSKCGDAHIELDVHAQEVKVTTYEKAIEALNKHIKDETDD